MKTYTRRIIALAASLMLAAGAAHAQMQPLYIPPPAPIIVPPVSYPPAVPIPPVTLPPAYVPPPITYPPAPTLPAYVPPPPVRLR